MMTNDNRVYLYDSTLRDGAQTQGVDFSTADKIAIAIELDRLGIDYIEGGWPGANPTDDKFFAKPPVLKKATLSAFGMTRRPGRSADNDPGLNGLVNTGVKTVTLVGKSWDFQVDVALEIERSENVAMIADSIAYVKDKAGEAMFDAEHFFDGYKANPEFALQCCKAAYEAGARWIVMCDTNGGTLPDEIEKIVGEVTKHIPGTHLGIHCHDDTGNAVANSLAAVRAGVRQIQGTLNGLGERCGNANLISILPSLMLKMGFETGVSEDGLTRLVHVSRMLDERLNRAPARNAAYVGESAFAHKGGLHVSAIEKDPSCYEHIKPESVGNERTIIMSNQAGRSNLVAKFREVGLEVDPKDAKVNALLDEIKELESNGYSYDGADASFELLARRKLENVPDYFHLESFRVIDERVWDAKHVHVKQMSETTVKLYIGDQRIMDVAEGNGPVNALDAALRKILIPFYPHLEKLHLVDFKVRILNGDKATGAITRVMIESADGEGNTWTTIGMSSNIIDASYEALRDSLVYRLYKAGVKAYGGN
ncbi:citramalate synthase [Terasakiella sp.]|uniref:citramalate synthase n=1 Tax=Terasakiella sp. TaxID=2034861 RepID=UPI003AA8BC8F